MENFTKTAIEAKTKYNIDYKIMLIDALKRFSENPATIENFSCYLDQHFFNGYLEKFASSPLDFISELEQFSKVEV